VPGPGEGFRHLRDREVWSGHHLRAVEADFAAPDGQEFTRELFRTGGAVAAVPLLDDGDTVVLVRQFRGALDDLLLEIPAGMLDVEGEDPEAAIRRELVEEVGYEAASVERLLHAHVAAGFSDHTVTVYLATGLTAVEADRQGPEEEHMTVERVSLRAAPGLVADGTITDGKTIMGLLAARQHLGVT
jgi:8-oxo-dGTP pyrophosphatase MutT (NUDIX family)